MAYPHAGDRSENERNSEIGVIRMFLVMPVLTALLLGSCDSTNSSRGGDSGNIENPLAGDWLIPQEEIVDGGPGKDGIPSIDDPQFESASGIDYVDAGRLVVGVNIGGEVRAYPHQVLDWHEIVNDHLGDEAVCVTLCPLTGTAMAWNREIEGAETEFGVSGLLFRNNLIAYDRNTDSNWSQMQLRSVNGRRSGKDIEIFQVLETTWETWLELYPDSEVLTTETGHQRQYSGYAYGSSYRTDDNRILFPVRNNDDRLDKKARVHGVISEISGEKSSVRVYPVDEFDDKIEKIEDSLGNREYLIVGSSGKNFAVAFLRTLPDGTRPSMEVVQDELPVILRDEEGNAWDIFGVAVEGPREGERLIPARSYTGYWFAWADFFPGLQIHGGPSL